MSPHKRVSVKVCIKCVLKAFATDPPNHDVKQFFMGHNTVRQVSVGHPAFTCYNNWNLTLTVRSHGPSDASTETHPNSLWMGWSHAYPCCLRPKLRKVQLFQHMCQPIKSHLCKYASASARQSNCVCANIQRARHWKKVGCICSLD